MKPGDRVRIKAGLHRAGELGTVVAVFDEGPVLVFPPSRDELGYQWSEVEIL